MPPSEIETLLESPIHEVRAGGCSIMDKQARSKKTSGERRKELYDLYMKGGLTMSQSRIDAFTAMVKDQPDNEMIWYGLANEYTKLAAWPNAADALRNVIRLKPDYTSAYQMLGTALANSGDVEEARRVWTEGIAIADRTGAWKARQHMEGLLAGMPPESETGFCTE